MKTLHLSNGDEIPMMGLGTWLSKPSEVYNAVLDAIRMGYRHIDCAYIYGNEKEVGDALQKAFSEGLVKREDIFITSKLWNSDHAPEDVQLAIRRTLENLQLDYLNLYLMHWPIAFKPGHEEAKSEKDLVSLNDMPLSDTWKAMKQLQDTGLTKHIGVSNFGVKKIEKLINETGFKPEMNQVELHPYFAQNTLVEFCHQHDILVTAYSPLGSKRTMNTDKGLDKEHIIIGIAAKHECTTAQVLLAWGMQRNTIVIPKSVKSERIKDNFDALKVNLDEEDMKRIADLNRNIRMSTGEFAVFPEGPYTIENIWND